MSGGRSDALLVIGIVLIPVGLFLIWTATGGREWNSTHNRALQRIDHVSKGQERYNMVAALVGAALAIGLGIALIAVR